MIDCFGEAKKELINNLFESRIDLAFFSEKILNLFGNNPVEFAASVPFERFPELKNMIENRKR